MGVEKSMIFHVDMDHFFSAVEERENPEYKGNPVIVGADPKGGQGRGVVKTCNYSAREFGIHSGMPISKAWQLCPTAVYVRGNYGLYKQVSAEIMKILKAYSNKFEQWGLDEAFLDLSSKVHNSREALKLAQGMKHEILKNLGLSCSIGIAPNKLVAKIASDLHKPDGLTIVEEDTIQGFLAPLPVRKLLWIGKKTEAKLKEMGIETIGDLASTDASLLAEKFGIRGKQYRRHALGKYDSEVVGRRGLRRSVGHEITFSVNTDDNEAVMQTLDRLCEKVHNKIMKRKLLFKTVTLKVRKESFFTRTYSVTLPFCTNALEDLQKAVRRLAQKNLDKKIKTRLVGVRVSKIISGKGQSTLV